METSEREEHAGLGGGVTWFKMEDDFADHPKVVAAGPAAAWVYVRSLCHVARYLTDGIVSRGVVRTIGATPRIIDRLVEVRLWDDHPDGFYVHNWLDRQKSKAELEELTRTKAEAGRLGGLAKALAGAKQTPSKRLAKVQQKSGDVDVEVENGFKSLAPNGASSASVPTADVKTVYEHWRTARGKTDKRYATISDKRRQKIKSRLREFSVAELCAAIDAVALDPWDERDQHDDLAVIFRSREQVERFLEFGDTPPDGSLSEAERWRREEDRLRSEGVIQ